MGQPVEERALTMGFPEKFEYCLRYQEREVPLDDDETTLTTQQRLLLYALKEQGSNGKNTSPAPSWWDARERAKWSAWSELGDMSKFEAMVYFTKTIEEIEKDWLLKELALEPVSTPTPPPLEVDSPKEESEPQEHISTCSASCSLRHIKSTCVRCKEDWGRHVNHICPDGGRGAWEVKDEDKDAHDEAEADVNSLLKQIQTLKYRLSTALRDVQVRDATIVELKADNQQLRQLLSHHNISSHPSSPPHMPSSPVRYPDMLPPPASAPAGYFQTKQKPTWMQWFTGAEANPSPAVI